ncbi:arginase family protein [Photobacterium nomapromontoriensis]|uniref:arginase family protein n=1 Tax=Photobacterium nomapromontoriensis TaxID=2910237 RepID=UPI003D0FDEE6
MTKQFDIIGAPFNLLGCHPTNNNPVDGLRCMDEQIWIGLSDWMHVRNTRWGIDAKDKGDITPSLHVQTLIEMGRKETALTEYCAELKTKVMASFAQGRIPITLGGDHSIAVGTVQAALDFYQKQRNEKVAVIWVDAHADCNSSPESNLHGKPVALLMNQYPHNGWLVEPELTLSPDDIYYIAVRDLMLNEYQLINKLGITNYGMDTIDAHGFRAVLNELIAKLEREYDRIYLSFDYDALDGSIFRACGTPNVGGLSAREALFLVHRLAASPKFIGVDFVEYLPELDPDGVSKELMIKLIDAVWGFRA